MSGRYSLLHILSFLFYLLGILGLLATLWLGRDSLVAFSAYRGAYVDRDAAFLASLLNVGGVLVASLSAFGVAQVIGLLVDIHAALYPVPRPVTNPDPRPAPSSSTPAPQP